MYQGFMQITVEKIQLSWEIHNCHGSEMVNYGVKPAIFIKASTKCGWS